MRQSTDWARIARYALGFGLGLAIASMIGADILWVFLGCFIGGTLGIDPMGSLLEKMGIKL